MQANTEQINTSTFLHFVFYIYVSIDFYGSRLRHHASAM